MMPHSVERTSDGPLRKVLLIRLHFLAIQIPFMHIPTALAMEKDALLFYRELVEMISPELCPAIRMIINQERSHITRLQEMLDSTPA